ncbi:MAG: hypothetical protein U0L73_11835 [Ruminococcus bromii]|nr:hypothetical protein [Ruminococcus bromii]
MGLVKDLQNAVKEDFINMFPNPQQVGAVLEGKAVSRYDETGKAGQKVKSVAQNVAAGAVSGLSPMMGARRMPRGQDGRPIDGHPSEPETDGFEID